MVKRVNSAVSFLACAARIISSHAMPTRRETSTTASRGDRATALPARETLAGYEPECDKTKKLAGLGRGHERHHTLNNW